MKKSNFRTGIVLLIMGFILTSVRFVLLEYSQLPGFESGLFFGAGLGLEILGLMTTP